MSKFTVHYFNGGGRAEGIRWVLAHGKVNFEDHRYARGDWPAAKPGMPLQQLPVLDWTDGKQKVTMCQSAAIIRFVANQLGLAGKNPIQSARADEAYETIREFQEALFKAMFEGDEAKKGEAMGKLGSEHGPRVFAFLEKRAKENGGKNLAGGDGYTYADLFLGALLEMLQGRSPVDLSAYPTVTAIGKAVAETEGVKAYLAKRPKGDF